MVHKMHIIWEGSLPGSGRGNLGRGAQETKVMSFLKKLLSTLTEFGKSRYLDLERGNLRRGAQATKVNSFLTNL